MSDRLPDRLADRLALEDLSARYAHALDHDDVAAFLGVFTDDALYTLGARRTQGQAELSTLFTARQSRGARVTRHFFSSLRIAFRGEREATGHSVWMSFAGQGEPPFVPAEPFMVADMEDRYVLHSNRWYIAERHITPVFRQAVTS